MTSTQTVETIPSPGAAAPGPAIHVVATTIPGTRDALDTAGRLARALDSRVHVIAACATPSAWSFAEQSAPVQALAREIRRLPEADSPRVDVLPCVCRRMTDITQLIPARAIVVLGGASHRWWPSREQQLAHDLTGLGYRVVFIHSASADEA